MSRRSIDSVIEADVTLSCNMRALLEANGFVVLQMLGLREIVSGAGILAEPLALCVAFTAHVARRERPRRR